MKQKCPLCSNDSTFILNFKSKKYYQCDGCHSIHLDKKNQLQPEDEKLRYLLHKNDVHDPGYREFVSPIVNYILSRYQPQSNGLDFGAGTGPVISKMLIEKGFTINQYDPFFSNHTELLSLQFDYIVCCEVIEHFNNPNKEFMQLRSMLLPGGELICMTELLRDNIDFNDWYYKNDPTHVFFYHPKSFDYIKSEFDFSEVIIDKRLIRFIV
jgi:SAM-dependent methyltransferase